MGGALFASGPDALTVPRLPNEIYYPLKEKLHALLSEYFDQVAVPTESPGKSDHGDIDFLVCGPMTTVEPKSLLTDKLNAKRTHNSGPTTSFAIPHPIEDGAYVHVDFHVCPEATFNWELYMHSYGDLTQILGVCIRPLGFTANDVGFHVRIPEMEESNYKDAMIFLTNKPEEMMEFLGLNVTQYQSGFPSELDMFNWVVRAPFFSKSLLSEQRSKSNDRARQRKRPQYQRFMEQFVPSQLYSLPEDLPEEWQRPTALARAVQNFNASTIYTQKLSDHAITQSTLLLWRNIALEIPLQDDSDTKKLNLAIRALKRWVEVNPTGLRIRITPNMNEDAASEFALRAQLLREEVVLKWVRENWEEVVRREKGRMKREKNERAAKRVKSGDGVEVEVKVESPGSEE